MDSLCSTPTKRRKTESKLVSRGLGLLVGSVVLMARQGGPGLNMF